MTGIARFYLTKLLKEHPHPLALVEAVDENALVEGEPAILHACSITYILSYIYFNKGTYTNIKLYNTMILIEFHAGSSELKTLVREFRTHALELLDMLDSSLPIVAKLKVN